MMIKCCANRECLLYKYTDEESCAKSSSLEILINHVLHMDLDGNLKKGQSTNY